MMEKQRLSSTTEASDSISSNSPTKRANTGTWPNEPSSSKYKGVVHQQNGHWGAQIYANHHRIWLGTFKTDTAAAAAYDSAAMKLRHGNAGEAHRNIPSTTLIIDFELKFQAQYTNDQVLNMIKDGSYQTKFNEFLSSISQVSNNPHRSNHNGNNQQGYFCQELFRKELTPSDVGKLNRLVIPKRYALKYFPVRDNNNNNNNNVSVFQGEDEGGDQGGDDDDDDDMELVFYDENMISWNFRYCYWRSSQSYVFTRGWNKFVKAKGLEAKDIVTFNMSEYKDNKSGEDVKFWVIGIVKDNGISDKLEGGIVYGHEIPKEEAFVVEDEAPKSKKQKGVWIFGVELVPYNENQII